MRCMPLPAAGRSLVRPSQGRCWKTICATCSSEILTDSWDLLTDREKEVLQLVAEGRSNKEVAAALSLSPYTVETHRGNLMKKLNLHNTAEIVLYAVRKKIIV